MLKFDSPFILLERLVERLKDAFGSDRHSDNGGVDASKTFEGLQNEEHRCQERHELSERDHALLRLPERNAEHDCHARHPDQLRCRRPDRRNLVDSDRKVCDLVVYLAKSLFLAIIRTGNLDEALGFIRLFHAHDERGDVLLTRVHHRLDLLRNPAKKLDDDGGKA